VAKKTKKVKPKKGKKVKKAKPKKAKVATPVKEKPKNKKKEGSIVKNKTFPRRFRAIDFNDSSNRPSPAQICVEQKRAGGKPRNVE